MIILCKKIKHYQKWIEAIKQRDGKHDIDTTVRINLKSIDNATLKRIILESAELLPHKKKIETPLQSHHQQPQPINHS